MLERGLVSRILFPAPSPSYEVDSFPHDLIWVPRTRIAKSDDAEPPPVHESNVPCLLLTYPSARFLIIFFHSNAEDLGRCHSFCCYLREQFQVHVLAVEYPGYGLCPGVATGESVMENALAAFRFATETLAWPLDSIKVFGRSIGTGPAIGLASLFRFAGVILVTPFLSIQELFRDRVGPFASFIDEWFENGTLAPKITAPTMIIHGQRDELIDCRHGESLYECIRARKLLVSPPEMEHNTNLLINLQFFVLPMFQFFALPDYAFNDLAVPRWAYDKRRSPFYVPLAAEVVCDQLPRADKKRKALLDMPIGDDGDLPKTLEDEDDEPIQKFSLEKVVPEVSRDRVTVRDAIPASATKGGYDFSRSRDDAPEVTTTAKPEEEAAARLEDISGLLAMGELCSDDLCILEERMDSDPLLHQQEKELERLVHMRQQRASAPAPSGGPPVAPRLMARRRGIPIAALACGTSWTTWCNRRPLVEEDEVRAEKQPPPPGLPYAKQVLSPRVIRAAHGDVAGISSSRDSWCGLGQRLDDGSDPMDMDMEFLRVHGARRPQGVPGFPPAALGLDDDLTPPLSPGLAREFEGKQNRLETLERTATPVRSRAFEEFFVQDDRGDVQPQQPLPSIWKACCRTLPSESLAVAVSAVAPYQPCKNIAKLSL